MYRTCRSQVLSVVAEPSMTFCTGDDGVVSFEPSSSGRVALQLSGPTNRSRRRANEFKAMQQLKKALGIRKAAQARECTETSDQDTQKKIDKEEPGLLSSFVNRLTSGVPTLDSNDEETPVNAAQTLQNNPTNLTTLECASSHIHELAALEQTLGIEVAQQPRRRNPKRSNFLPFAEAREYVRRLGLRNNAEWLAWRKTSRPDFIPSNPNVCYRNTGWQSMADWLGLSLEEQAAILRERKAKRNAKRSNFLPFAEAREYVRRLGLRTRAQWFAWRKTSRPDFIPSCPNVCYRNTGWQSMADWLGLSLEEQAPREKPNYLPFAEAREYVRRLGLRKWYIYSKTKRPKFIPRDPSRTYFHEGWVSMADWLGLSPKKTSRNSA